MGALPHPPQTVLLKHCPHFGGKRPVPLKKRGGPPIQPFFDTPAQAAANRTADPASENPRCGKISRYGLTTAPPHSLKAAERMRTFCKREELNGSPFP